ncbi:MAG: pilus assembly protein N-terminal domain-containing protein [Pseudomonadota bacterium]
MRLIISSIMAAAIIGTAIPAAAAISSQSLMKGQSTTVELGYDVGDVAVADPGVCDYIVSQDRRSIYVNARGGGETMVTVWDAAGAKRDEFQVRVVTTSLKEVLDKAKSEFGELSGVKVSVQNGHVEVTGEVAEPEDFRHIEGVARQDPRIRSRIRLAHDAIGQLADAIAKSIDVPGVTVRSVRDRIVLEGVAYSQADAKRAVEIAKLYSPEVLDLIDARDTKRQVGRGKMIELTFHMMEIKKSALRQLGINWAPGAFPSGGHANAGNGSGAGLLSSISGLGKELIGFVFQLVPKLQLVRERGDGRVLENPSIVVKSGEDAKIFSGTEVPYYKGQDVQFKKMGIDIEATPIEVAGGVDVKLTATLSSPTADLRGAIDTNTVSTSAICKFGQSLVLGNIVRNGEVKMRNRVPRDLDTSSALFALFLSKDFQSNRSEFVIFVTPRLVEQPTPAEAELKEFLATEESMIRDRSKKEYGSYLAGRRGGDVKEADVDGGAAASETRRPQRRKWR